MEKDRFRALAALCGLLGVVGIVLVWVEIASAPEPKGDGLPAAFSAAFALLLLLSSLAAIVEAGLLWAAVIRWEVGPWSRGLFAGGATAGALATLPRAVQTFVFATDTPVDGPWIMLWSLLAVWGFVLAGVGVLAGGVEPLDRRDGVALAGGVAVLLALHVGSIAFETLDGFFWQLIVFTLGCASLGSVLSVADPLDRPVVRGSLAAVAAVAVAVAVVRWLAGSEFDAVLFGLLALAPLWALVSTFDGDASVRSLAATG